MNLEKYFTPFRDQVVGRDQTFTSPFGEQKIILGDIGMEIIVSVDGGDTYLSK